MIQAIIGILCGVGLFFVLVDVYKIPYYKTSKAVESLSKRQSVKTSGLDIWLSGFAGWLSKHIRINDFTDQVPAGSAEVGRRSRKAAQGVHGA